MFVFLFIMGMLTPLLMFFVGILWKKHPPKDINGIYGYRTALSMKNQDTWDFAHKYCGKIWFWCGIATGIISAGLLLFYRNSPDFEDVSVILIFVQCAVLVVTIFPTQIALKKHFSNNGKRKIDN